jgi:uncharacterized protein (TIGR04255 family)
MPVERLDSAPSLATVEFRVGQPPAKTRIWLISEDDERLIQIQRDWFAYNWRKRGGQYGRYEEGRSNFVSYFERFERFIEDLDLGKIEPKQCEVTYVNHIRTASGSLGDLSDVLRIISQPELVDPAVAVEASQLNMAFSLRDGDTAVGRLHLTIIANVVNDQPVWVLNLTARGVPLGSGLGGVLDFFDLGRKAIVTNFKVLTTETMHEQWGLQ